MPLALPYSRQPEPPLGLDELAQAARRLARGPRPYLELAGEVTRAYHHLRDEPNLSAWIIRWGQEADTGFHDHDVSAGAVHVISGRIVEERLSIAGDHEVRRYGPGDTFAFEPSEIHRVTPAGAE